MRPADWGIQAVPLSTFVISLESLSRSNTLRIVLIVRLVCIWTVQRSQVLGA